MQPKKSARSMTYLRFGGRDALRCIQIVMAILAMLAVHQPVVHACTLPPPGIHSRHVFPVDGSVGVPTNIKLLVTYQKEPGFNLRGDVAVDPTAFGLREKGGDEIAFTTERLSVVPGQFPKEAFLVTPLTTFKPNADYEIWDRLAFDSAPCEAVPPTVFSTFTTGAAPDTVPPVFGGVKGYEIRRDSCQTYGSCCYLYDNMVVTLKSDSALDDIAGARISYNVYVNGVPVAKRVPLEQRFGVCVGPALLSLPATTGTFSVKAVDWAGNEDGNTATIFIPASVCDELKAMLPRDGGALTFDASPSADAVAPNDAVLSGGDASSSQQADSGCGCRVGGAFRTGRAREGLFPLVAFVGTIAIRSGVRRRLRRYE